MNAATVMNINALEGAMLERQTSEKAIARTALDVSSGAIHQPMSSDCCGSNNYPTPTDSAG